MVGEYSKAMSRRDFVRTAGGATAAAAVGSSEAAAQEEVTIDMTDGLVFDPDSTTVAPGTTVVWDNVGTVGHSVTAYEDGIPEDAEFFASGGLESEDEAREAYPDQGDVPGGETYEHTFEVEGTYEYFCIPHESAGMVAELTVSEDAGGNGDAGGEGVVPGIPESAQIVGIVAVAAMVIVMAFAYFFLKYGGDYGLE